MRQISSPKEGICEHLKLTQKGVNQHTAQQSYASQGVRHRHWFLPSESVFENIYILNELKETHQNRISLNLVQCKVRSIIGAQRLIVIIKVKFNPHYFQTIERTMQTSYQKNRIELNVIEHTVNSLIKNRIRSTQRLMILRHRLCSYWPSIKFILN